jgi:type VI secretion system protein ImpH
VAAARGLEGIALMLGRLEERLRRTPSAFGFFQAVRVLDRLRPGRVPVGGFDDPTREVVRFSVPTTLGFPPGEIRELDLPEDESQQARLEVNFLGLTGPQGVLPHHYTLLAAERERARDGSLRDFLDIFHHRLISLFYRAWRKTRFTVVAEGGGEDALRDHLLDLAGVGLEPLRRSLRVPENAVAYYAGLLGMNPPGAVALEQLLHDFFGVPVAVAQFVGGWSRIRSGDITALDDDAALGGALGGGAIAGDEVWDAQAGARIRLGPLTREQFDAFLPTGSLHETLRALTRLFTRGQVQVSAQLVLARDEVPGLVLGGERETAQRMGWTTWIRSRTFGRDADETTFSL